MSKENRNDFIVDVSNARKSSEIIYELSNILSMPDAKHKKVCLKLGDVDLSSAQLQSIRALVECMNSSLKFIATESAQTIFSANELGIEVSEIENKINIPEFDENNKEKASKELEKALDKIFGDDYFDAGDYEYDETPAVKIDIEDEEEQPAPVVIVESISTEEFEEEKPGMPEVSLEMELKKALEEHVPDKDEYQKETKSSSKVILDEDGNDITEEVKKSIRATEKLPTMYIQRNIRSGQSVSFNGNIVLIGSAHPGSEIIAKGEITVWGILGGIAHAGCKGNRYARIRALKLNAIQLRIADVFARRPDSINLPYIQRTDTYTPEEASVKNSRIVIQKLHEE